MTIICATEGISAVGNRIRAFREEKGIDLEMLSGITGLEPEFLRKLESGQIYPSIGPLQKVARALDVRLGTFIDDQQTGDPVICALNQPDSPGDAIGRTEPAMETGKRPAYVYQALGKGKSDRNMEPFCVEIYPCNGSEIKTSSHQGEEFIYVLSGELLVIYGLQRYALKPGNTIYYNSIVPHYLGANGDEPCRILAVTYNP